MNGSYTKVLGSNVWTISCDILSDGTQSNFSVITKNRAELEEENPYHLVRSSKCNKACPNLVRSIFLLKDVNGEIAHQTVLLQYYIASGAEEIELQVLPHGSKKQKETSPSIRQRKAL